MKLAIVALLLAGCGAMPAAVGPGPDADVPQDAHVAGLDATGVPDAAAPDAAPDAPSAAPDEPDAAAPGADAGPPCGVDEHSPCCAGVPYDQACVAPRLCYQGPHGPWCETRGLLGNVCADNNECATGLTCYLNLCLACGFPGTMCCSPKDRLTPCGACANGYCYGGTCHQGGGCQ